MSKINLKWDGQLYIGTFIFWDTLLWLTDLLWFCYLLPFYSVTNVKQEIFQKRIEQRKKMLAKSIRSPARAR